MTADPYLLVPLSGTTGVVFDGKGGAGYATPGADGAPLVQRPANAGEAQIAAGIYWGFSMPVTQDQINAAADIVAVAKLQTTLQLEAAVAAENYRTAEAKKADDYRAAQLALLARQTAAGEALLAINREAASGLASREQEAFAELFKLCLEARRVPLTTAATDAAMADIMRDAMYMATFAWPQYKAQLDALAAQPAATDAV